MFSFIYYLFLHGSCFQLFFFISDFTAKQSFVYVLIDYIIKQIKMEVDIPSSSGTGGKKRFEVHALFCDILFIINHMYLGKKMECSSVMGLGYCCR